jgi:hypothetical protein
MVIIGLVMMVVSLFVAQAGDRNRALMPLANVLTLGGFALAGIGALIYFLG